MKKYNAPELDIVQLTVYDVITTSQNDKDTLFDASEFSKSGQFVN